MTDIGPRWRPAYIGLGSNLKSPRQQVSGAIDELCKLPGCVVTGVSSLYRSAPMGPGDQPDYINAVVTMVTQLTSYELLARLQMIEVSHGRERNSEQWVPRTLDLDLLVYSDMQLDDAVLRIPHPGIADRNFVLLPLQELAPSLRVPGKGTVAALAAVATESGARIEKLD